MRRSSTASARESGTFSSSDAALAEPVSEAGVSHRRPEPLEHLAAIKRMAGRRVSDHEIVVVTERGRAREPIELGGQPVDQWHRPA
jgi:hypothetical protein